MAAKRLHVRRIVWIVSRGVPQGDHKEASKPRGLLPPGGFSLVPIKKKRDRFAAAVSTITRQ